MPTVGAATPEVTTHVFFAYPSDPTDVGETIQAAVHKVVGRPRRVVTPWPQIAVAGQFVGTRVLESIARADLLAADVTVLNFNVTYEVGYAVGCGKPVLPVRNVALSERPPTAKEVGIFDTIGYATYANSDELVRTLETAAPTPLLTQLPGNAEAPVYLLQSKLKTDFAIRVAARIKKARLSFCSASAGTRLPGSRVSYRQGVRDVEDTKPPITRGEGRSAEAAPHRQGPGHDDLRGGGASAERLLSLAAGAV